MPISAYLKGLREHIGHDLVLSPSVADVIRDEAGNVLIHQRSDNGAWEVPAGAVDPDEAPAQALVREVFEETGLKVRPVKVIGVFGGSTVVHPNGDVIGPYATLFECEVTGGRLEARDGEALAFRWVRSVDVPEHNVFPKHVFAADFTGVYFAWNERWLAGLAET